ncbi:MAG: hypothetical protein WBP26_02080 [Candidatus Saccharimonadales bacterium]
MSNHDILDLLIPKENPEYLKTLTDEAKRFLADVHEWLASSGMESKKLRLDNKPIDELAWELHIGSFGSFAVVSTKNAIGTHYKVLVSGKTNEPQGSPAAKDPTIHLTSNYEGGYSTEVSLLALTGRLNDTYILHSAATVAHDAMATILGGRNIPSVDNPQ